MSISCTCLTTAEWFWCVYTWADICPLFGMTGCFGTWRQHPDSHCLGYWRFIQINGDICKTQQLVLSCLSSPSCCHQLSVCYNWSYRSDKIPIIMACLAMGDLSMVLPCQMWGITHDTQTVESSDTFLCYTPPGRVGYSHLHNPQCSPWPQWLITLSQTQLVATNSRVQWLL